MCVCFVFGYYFPDVLTSSCTFYATGILFPWDNTFTGNRFQRPGRRDTAATGKGTDILLSYDVRTYLYYIPIRIVSTYKMRRRVDLYCVENNKIIPRSAILDGYTSVGA